jgi:uncharacterized membrane protein
MLIANTVLVAVMTGISVWAAQTIPEGAQVPVHWNLNGEPDGVASKAEALLFMPTIALLSTALMWLLPKIDPRRANMAASGKFWNAVSIAVVAFLAYVHGLVLLNASGRQLEIPDYLLPALALMMVVIGNYLSKTRSNWFGGVRTPWTMSSDYAWDRTHRWAGRLFVASGAAGIAAWMIADSRTAFFVLTLAVLASSLVSVALSYVFWKADPTRSRDAQANGGA